MDNHLVKTLNMLSPQARANFNKKAFGLLKELTCQNQGLLGKDCQILLDKPDQPQEINTPQKAEKCIEISSEGSNSSQNKQVSEKTAEVQSTALASKNPMMQRLLRATHRIREEPKPQVPITPHPQKEEKKPQLNSMPSSQATAETKDSEEEKQAAQQTPAQPLRTRRLWDSSEPDSPGSDAPSFTRGHPSQIDGAPSLLTNQQKSGKPSEFSEAPKIKQSQLFGSSLRIGTTGEEQKSRKPEPEPDQKLKSKTEKAVVAPCSLTTTNSSSAKPTLSTKPVKPLSQLSLEEIQREIEALNQDAAKLMEGEIAPAQPEEEKPKEAPCKKSDRVVIEIKDEFENGKIVKPASSPPKSLLSSLPKQKTSEKPHWNDRQQRPGFPKRGLGRRTFHQQHDASPGNLTPCFYCHGHGHKWRHCKFLRMRLYKTDNLEIIRMLDSNQTVPSDIFSFLIQTAKGQLEDFNEAAIRSKVKNFEQLLQPESRCGICKKMGHPDDQCFFATKHRRI